ncbi:serine hydrolase [Streptomyces sp. NPDC006463]|uniref:serine hydrolase n=1 Tax=Streptomyces sp. NPDC006463 TaxID=3364746 RepID=UPI00368F45AE
MAQRFQDRLFAPLGLKETSLPGIHDRSLPEPYSHGYMYGGTQYALVDRPYPAAMSEAARTGKLQPLDYTHQNPSYATAAGGVISTADDLATWITALVTGKVLNAASQQQWLRRPRTRRPRTARRTATASPTSASPRTPRCTTTAVNSRASTPSSATTRTATPPS